MRTLPRTVAETAIGTVVPVQIVRGGTEQVLHLTVAELPDDAKPQAAAPKPAPVKAKLPGAAIAGLGLTLAPLDDALRSKYGIPADATGAVITGVAKTGPVADRLRPGDLIVEVDQTEIKHPGDVDRAIASARDAKRPSLLMLVMDKDGQRWVPVPLAAPSTPATNRKGG